MRAPLVLLPVAAFIAAPAIAQPASSADPAAHAVPFASRGNAVELTLAAPPGAGRPDTVEVSAGTLPPWLHLAPTRVRVVLAPGAEAVARFTFDVDETAPIGEAAALPFEVQAAGGRQWAREVRVVVEPPRTLALGAASPNPIRTAAVVPLVMPEAARVRVALYDVLGRQVAVLAEGAFEPGRHVVRLDGRALAGGVYVLRAEVERPGGTREVVARPVTVLR